MRYFLTALFFAFVFTAKTPVVFAQEKIESFDVEIVAHKDGKMTVTEKIAYDFGESDRHGIFRFIPTVSKVGDLYRVIKINFLEVKRDGNIEPYEIDNMPKTSQIKIGDADKEINGLHNYIIIYGVENGIGSNFETHDEIYWNVTGNEWEVPIQKANYKLTTDFGVSPIGTICFTGRILSKDQNCKTEGSVITSTEEIKPYEGLTVVTKFPVNTFPDSELRSREPLIDPDFLSILKIYLPVMGVLNLIVGPYLLFWYFRKHKRRNPGTPSVNFDIPINLSPVEAGIIDNTKLERNDVIATIFDLAIRKYIKIEEIKIAKTLMPDETDYKIIQLKDEAGLNTFESTLFNRLFRDGDEVKLKDLSRDFYATFASLENQAFSLLVEKKLYIKNPKYQMGFLLVFGIITLALGNVILGPVLIYLSKKMNSRTELGDTEDLQVDGLKIFLKAMSRHHKFQSKNLITVEKYIPYAIALGLQNEFMEQLRIIDPNYKPTWYSGQHTFLHSYSGIYSSMNSITTSAPSSSSGFSGGSSGGGGGGGGGGSW